MRKLFTIYLICVLIELLLDVKLEIDCYEGAAAREIE